MLLESQQYYQGRALSGITRCWEEDNVSFPLTNSLDIWAFPFEPAFWGNVMGDSERQITLASTLRGPGGLFKHFESNLSLRKCFCPL